MPSLWAKGLRILRSRPMQWICLVYIVSWAFFLFLFFVFEKNHIWETLLMTFAICGVHTVKMNIWENGIFSCLLISSDKILRNSLAMLLPSSFPSRSLAKKKKEKANNKRKNKKNVCRYVCQIRTTNDLLYIFVFCVCLFVHQQLLT